MTKNETVSAALELLVKQANGHLELIELMSCLVSETVTVAAKTAEDGEGKEAVANHYFQLLKDHIDAKQEVVLAEVHGGIDARSAKIGDYVPACYYASAYGKSLSTKTKFSGSDGWLDESIFTSRFNAQPKVAGLNKTDERRVLELCKRMFLAGVTHERAMTE